jgi:rhodanese-related sulfurtransferase
MPEFQQLVNEAKRHIQEINVDDLKKMQQNGEDFSLIDVRDKQDADKGMISAGACWSTRSTR